MIFIYSFGGYAREFSRLLRDQHGEKGVYFIDDAPTGPAITYTRALEMDPNRRSRFIIGFADAALRRKKTELVRADGFRLSSVFAKTAIVGDNVIMGAGAIMSDFAMVTSDSMIGASFQCNIYSYIAHDCIVGDFVTLAPRVSVNGRVHIDDNVYIGTGATILPGTEGQPLHIGQGAIIGAHALVTRDVPPHTTVVGMPAKPLLKKG